MSEAFRVASNSSSGNVTLGSNGGSGKSSVSSTLDPGLYTFEAVKGYPYGVKHFNLKNFYDSGNYPELTDQLKEVDAYIYQKAKDRSLEDTGKSYEEVVNEILDKIGKSKNEEPFNTFKRVTAAVQAMQRLKEAKLSENLDLQNLTSKEIEDISEQ